jgi:N12 class adenine-specific DNA methylase
MAPALGQRIVQTYPALQSPKDAPAPALKTLLRTPLPAQALAITGLAKYLKKARAARIVAECGAGKTFMSLGTMHVHAGTKPYKALVMCPPHIVHKWAREALLTVPNARAFIVEDLRNGGDPKNTHGIVEVKLENGSTVVKGRIIAAVPEDLRSVLAAGIQDLSPMNDAIKQAVAQREIVEGATVTRGYHVRVA